MKKLFTFIMNSEEIGEVIEQFPGQEMIDAWHAFAPSASNWILQQLPDAGMIRKDVIHEFLLEVPKPLKGLNNVWLVDVLPDNCPEVIQVVIVG